MSEKIIKNQSPQIQRFRKATLEDRSILNHLMRQGKGYWGYAEEGLDRWMATFGISNDSYFEHALGFIAESDEETIGYYLFKTDESPPMLDYFFLDIRFIGQGYGRKLWSHCIEQAKSREWKEFTFWADPHSLGFYEHMGAVKIDEGPMITMPGLMCPIMRFIIPGG
ncbi:MAG: GNAT family N-acetyltransferase [Alphaproteobacteria bacterium]|jgi:GNAT superfamily N-acetyltransferase|nr:GNAT family N-acetyltransferase [Alphaproteobacteria bacterium]